VSSDFLCCNTIELGLEVAAGRPVGYVDSGGGDVGVDLRDGVE
jgi:hypothetical protein